MSTPPPVEEKRERVEDPETVQAPPAKHELLVASHAKPADDLEEDFFSDARIHTPQAFAVSEEIEVEPPKPSPKMTPMARARRAHFSKYVKGAMVAATAILALAGIRVATGHADRGPGTYAASASLAPARPAEPEAPKPAAAAPPAVQPAPVAAPVIEPPKEEAPAEPPAAEAKVEATQAPAKAEPTPEPTPEPAKVAAPTPAPEPAKGAGEAAKPTAAAPAAPAAAGDKTALQEKVEARKALERGKAAVAIEAGERSVALDPTDGEAWLLLGAAYQEKGNLPKARAAFQSCLKEAKRGPKAECKAMLQ